MTERGWRKTETTCWHAASMGRQAGDEKHGPAYQQQYGYTHT